MEETNRGRGYRQQLSPVEKNNAIRKTRGVGDISVGRVDKALSSIPGTT